MTKQELKDIWMISQYMEVKNIFPYKLKQTNGKPYYIGLYEAINDKGDIHFEEGACFYSPDKDWNILMEVCKKIINSYFDNRNYIFDGLHKCDINLTYKAVVDFLHFWYDDTKPKYTWTDHIEQAKLINEEGKVIKKLNKYPF